MKKAITKQERKNDALNTQRSGGSVEVTGGGIGRHGAVLDVDSGLSGRRAPAGRGGAQKAGAKQAPATLRKQSGPQRGQGGYAYGRAMTLKQVAEVMGVSRERVRQIEEKALRKLRAQGIALGILKGFDVDHSGRQYARPTSRTGGQ